MSEHIARTFADIRTAGGSGIEASEEASCGPGELDSLYGYVWREPGYCNGGNCEIYEIRFNRNHAELRVHASRNYGAPYTGCWYGDFATDCEFGVVACGGDGIVGGNWSFDGSTLHFANMTWSKADSFLFSCSSTMCE